MNTYILPMQKMIDCFRRLPGVGGKSAVRMAFGVLDMSQQDAEEFCDAVMGMKRDIVCCSVCQNLSDKAVCDICADSGRDGSMICVVEDARDVIAIERTNDYRGMYHVTGGVISPVDGIGPEQLKIKELISRLSGDEVREVIIATNPDIEGETTAIYISKLIKPLNIRVTRLAYGVPVGADLEYADGETLARAIAGRREI